LYSIMSMSTVPEFPAFRGIELEDRDTFRSVLRKYHPETSELTFTNFYIWRAHYGFQWSLYKDWLLVICEDGQKNVFAMIPVGPSPRNEVVPMLLEWLRKEKGLAEPSIERADGRLVSELQGVEILSVEPTRDHFDYVYGRRDLVQLAGNKYRSKRNHINQLVRSYSFEYATLNGDHVNDCLELQEKWCLMRRCEDDLNLSGEWEAVKEILRAYDALEIEGGVITIGGKVVAFTIGELLNPKTAVIHIEKADPEIPGLYPMINQAFLDKNWGSVHFVNREQDLGDPGLREAKVSYYPDHFVEKFRITLK
jgi:uncharacterized protein